MTLLSGHLWSYERALSPSFGRLQLLHQTLFDFCAFTLEPKYLCQIEKQIMNIWSKAGDWRILHLSAGSFFLIGQAAPFSSFIGWMVAVTLTLHFAKISTWGVKNRWRSKSDPKKKKKSWKCFNEFNQNWSRRPLEVVFTEGAQSLHLTLKETLKDSHGAGLRTSSTHQS